VKAKKRKRIDTTTRELRAMRKAFLSMVQAFRKAHDAQMHNTAKLNQLLAQSGHTTTLVGEMDLPYIRQMAGSSR
jgi:hypothetical protein